MKRTVSKRKNIELWEKNKQNKINKIIEAAQVVFIEIGYDAATVRDIVRESGHSVGTFYNYFDSKDTLFRILIEKIVSDVRLRIRNARAQAKTAHDLIENAYRAFFEECSKDPQTLKLIARNQVQFRAMVFQGDEITSIFSELEHDLEEAIENKLIPEIPVQLATWAMIGAGLEILVRMTKYENLDIIEVSHFLTNIFVGGFVKYANMDISLTPKQDAPEKMN